MAKDIEPKIKSNDPRGDRSGKTFDELRNELNQQPELKANGQQGDATGSGFKHHMKEAAKREATNAAVHGGLYAAEKGAFGNKIKPLGKLGREELNNLEKNKGYDAYDLTKNAKGKLFNPAETGKGVLKKGLKHLVRRHKRALFVTLLVNVMVAIVLLALFFVAPFKSVHFETVMRSANFARFQLLVRKHFSAVVFNAAVLTQDSVGNFRNSPLVRQIRLAVPDSQLEQLGREGKLQWEFNANNTFGQEFLPIRETLKAVVIDGKRYEIDQFAKDAFGKNYSELTTRQRWTVQNNFIKAVNVELGDLMALTDRYVRWNPMVQLHQRTGVRLVKWLNAARDYAGLDPDEANGKFAEETAERVRDGPASEVEEPKSSIDDINEDAQYAKDEQVKAAKEGRPPGVLRSKLGAKAQVARGISDAVFASTAYCIGRELTFAFGSPEAQMDRQAQAVRMGSDLATTSDQIKSHDVVPEAVGASNHKWDSQGSTPDAGDSVLYRRITGQEPVSSATQGQQVPWLDQTQVLGEWADEFNFLGETIGSGSILGSIGSLLGIDFISDGSKKINDTICKALLNEYVQYGIAGAEIIFAIATLGASKGVTAGIKAGLELTFHFAAGVGLDILLTELMKWVVKEYARLYFTGLEQGSDRFNQGYVAQNSIAQNTDRNVNYGRPMDQNETNASQQVAMEALRAENENKSFSHRYFAIDNPFSLLGLTVAKLPTSTGGFTASLQNGLHFMGSILSSPTRLVGSLGSIFAPQSRAAAENLASQKSVFGVTQWSWTVAEQQRIENEESFSLQAQPGQDPPLLAYVEPRMDEFNERYGKCYDPNTFQLQFDQPEECTRDFLATDDALHWRYYKALMFAAEHQTGSL